ncbi:MAG: efflux RND transporter periplasmic adaptor subunit [Gemmatimonadota bacterium]
MKRFLTAIGLVVACRADPAADLTFRGTVEVREIEVASLAAGRVLEVRVDEGALVEAGDTIAVLGAPTLVADIAAAEAVLAGARARVRDLEAGSRPEELAGAEAALRARIAEAARLARDRDRLKALLDAGAVSPRDYEAAATAAEVAERTAEASRDGLQLLKAGTRSAQIAAARAEVDRSAATLAARHATTGEFILLAPRRGIVLTRVADPGDLVAVGAPVVRLGMTQEPWVRVYVPASLLSGLHIGDSAGVVPPGVDIRVADAGSSARGKIVAINPRAEYVTRTALSEDERADLLFGVKIAIHDPDDRFKPGMPTTVRLYPVRMPE